MSDMQGNDYVSMAKFRLEGVHEQQSDEGMTDATLIATALDAQIHATLALAYEQRTANLIAWNSLCGTHSGVDRSSIAALLGLKEDLQ